MEIQERRYFDRMPLRLPVIVKRVSDGSVREAVLSNLGAKGIGIESQEQLPQDGEVNMRVEMPGSAQYLNLRGNLVWARESFPQGWKAGVSLKEQSVNLVTFSLLLEKASRV